MYTETVRINKSSRGKAIVTFSDTGRRRCKARTGLRCVCKARLIYEHFTDLKSKTKELLYYLRRDLPSGDGVALALCEDCPDIFFTYKEKDILSCLKKKCSTIALHYSELVIEIIYIQQQSTDGKVQPTLPTSDNQVFYTLLFQEKTAARCSGTTEVRADGSAPVTPSRASPLGQLGSARRKSPSTAGIRLAPGETPPPSQEWHQKAHTPTNLQPKIGVMEGVALEGLGS